MAFTSSPTSVKSFEQNTSYPGQILGDFVKIKGINIEECSFSNSSFELWDQNRGWHLITFINAKWSKPQGLFVSNNCDYLCICVCVYLCIDVCVPVSVCVSVCVSDFNTSNMKTQSFYHSNVATASVYFRKQDQHSISRGMNRIYLGPCQTSMVSFFAKIERLKAIECFRKKTIIDI